MMTELKQVIIIRNDLNMRKGKMIAQGAHASLSAILDGPAICADMQYVSQWKEQGQRKIVVSVDSEQELRELYSKCLQYLTPLPLAFIIDAGYTEFHGVATPTAIAIGPGPSDEIDKITGHLKLL